jgi:hypothetical protein
METEQVLMPDLLLIHLCCHTLNIFTIAQLTETDNML